MQKVIDYLKEYNTKVSPLVPQVIKAQSSIIGEDIPLINSAVENLISFLSGGKRLRGAEIYLGYKIFGGLGPPAAHAQALRAGEVGGSRGNEETALLASLTIEIAHAFLLIHDDIIDRDALRRGAPTIHMRYAKGKDLHYGESMAIVIGDVAMFWAFRILNSLDLPAERKSKAIELLTNLLYEVGVGEALDVMYEEERRFSEKDVLQVHRYKTANYTISGPLMLGAILAGASEDNLKAISGFGIPVGIAFQLRDDELGMFSTEEEIGKPADSDLKEGKVTLLIVKALENAQGEDLEFLRYAHGNKDLTPQEVDRVREVMKSSGALKYSQEKSRELVEKGKEFIPEITDDPDAQAMLAELADFMIERKS